MSRSLRAVALSTVAALILSGCAGMSETPPAAETAAEVAVTAVSYDQLMADVRILSADDMEGPGPSTA